MAQERTVLSGVPTRERLLWLELAAEMVEVARGRRHEGGEVVDMTRRQEERNALHAEAEGGADIVWVELQQSGVAYAADTGTMVEDSVESRLAWAAVPSVGGNMDSLVVASYSAAWAGRASHVFDDLQASASAHKAGPSDSSFARDVTASVTASRRHWPAGNE